MFLNIRPQMISEVYNSTIFDIVGGKMAMFISIIKGKIYHFILNIYWSRVIHKISELSTDTISLTSFHS